MRQQRRKPRATAAAHRHDARLSQVQLHQLRCTLAPPDGVAAAAPNANCRTSSNPSRTKRCESHTSSTKSAAPGSSACITNHAESSPERCHHRIAASITHSSICRRARIARGRRVSTFPPWEGQAVFETGRQPSRCRYAVRAASLKCGAMRSKRSRSDARCLARNGLLPKASSSSFATLSSQKSRS